MKQYTLDQLTDSVVAESTDRIKDQRSKQVIAALIRHLHDFVRETKLTDDEWMSAIEFLTAVGQKCDARRQEFILLSDVLGVSSLVDALASIDHHGATESTVLGPFYQPDSPKIEVGGSIIRHASSETPMLMRGLIHDADQQAIENAKVEVWQTSSQGLYDVQNQDYDGADMRAHLFTDDSGHYAFITEQPKPYSIPQDGPVGSLLTLLGRHAMRPAHIHFKIEAEGFHPLVTHVFFSGDEYLGSDAVFASKQSLVLDLDSQPDTELGRTYGLDQAFVAATFDFCLSRS